MFRPLNKKMRGTGIEIKKGGIRGKKLVGETGGR